MKIRVKIDSEIFDVEVGDLNVRPVQARIGGELFEVWPEEGSAPAIVSTNSLVLDSAQPSFERHGLDARDSLQADPVNQSRIVQAPIPGVILSVSVKAGDEIKLGQELCILEAMKMKNIIRANRAGKVSVVHVEAGEQVHHGEALIEFVD